MSEVEWAEEYDWSKVAREGGRVRLCKGGDEHIFTISGSEVTQYPGRGPKVFFLRDANAEVEYDSRDGWKLFVERPIVALPTEPGYYLDKYEDVLCLDSSRRWLSNGKPVTLSDKHLQNYSSPFRRLMPVDEVRSETAKELVSSLDVRVALEIDRNFGYQLLGTVGEIVSIAKEIAAKEFGVTDE